MKRLLARSVLVLAVAAAACSEPAVVVEVAITPPGGSDAAPLGDLPIRILPYDRDAIIDSLTAMAPTAEPSIPADLQLLRDSAQAARAAYDRAEALQQSFDDSLALASQQTALLERQGLRGSDQYTAATDRLHRLEAAQNQVKLQMDLLFQQFTEVHTAALGRADSLRVAREVWAEEAYRDFEQVVAAKLRRSDLQEHVDTTNAAGTAVFRVPEGRWWVYTRYLLPYEELYWNVPLEVTSDSAHLELNEDNAQHLPVL